MTHETPSPPPDRSAQRQSYSKQGPETGREASRELSPWSARRAMTLAGGVKDSRPPRRRSRSRSRDRTSNGSYRKTEVRPSRPERKSRSRSRERKPRHDRDRFREGRPKGERDTSRGRKKSVKEASPESRSKRDRSGSPEPYREPRERSRDRRRDRSTDRKRDRSREKYRERSSDRRRDISRDKRRDRSRDKKRDRSRDRSRSKDRKRVPPLPYRFSRKSRSRSRSPKRRKSSPSSPPPRSRKSLPSQEVSFRGLDDSTQPPSKYGGAPPTLEKPNFKPTGLLAKEANKVTNTKISLKYHEPPESRKPPASSPWRLWIFKGADTLGTIELHTQSCWLLGRAAAVADIVLEHPSASQQHAAIQFRHIVKSVEDEYGVRRQKGKVKPYVIDLESSNGTELNDEEIEKGRYYELRDKDILKFGGSEREYMLMLPPKE